jgi:hypothetical protein
MIAGLLLRLPWLKTLGSLAIGPLKWLFAAAKRNPLAALLIVALLWQAWSSRQEIRARDRTIAEQTQLLRDVKDENARLNGAIRQLSEAVKNLKPGERTTAEIPKPQYIPYAVPGPLRIEYIREPGRIETRVETIQLAPKEIEKVIDKSPQSIIAEFTATRDIAKGEKFRLVAAQIAPGVYQPILELGAPVTAEVRTATPLDRIPTPTVEPSRWSFAGLAGMDVGHPRGATILTGLETEYRLTRSTARVEQFARLAADWRWNGAGASGRLLYGFRF